MSADSHSEESTEAWHYLFTTFLKDTTRNPIGTTGFSSAQSRKTMRHLDFTENNLRRMLQLKLISRGGKPSKGTSWTVLAALSAGDVPFLLLYDIVGYKSGTMVHFGLMYRGNSKKIGFCFNEASIFAR